MICPILCLAVTVATQTPLPRLHASGLDLVDPSGKPVLLRGVNLGGWLVEEMWMTPWIQDPPPDSQYGRVVDHATLWAAIGKHLGPAAAARVRKAYRNAWITANDFKRIKAAGFNHVRLPFLASLLDEPNGINWLKKAVKWAGENGLYVVLDMHGAPGGQSGEHHTGVEGLNQYFKKPANVDESIRVWTQVAAAFANDPTVVAFDLLNEPTGAPDPDTLYKVYDRLYDAVRRVAPDTAVIIDDGFKGFETTPFPVKKLWKNVVYSLHFYQFDAKKTEDHVASLKGRLEHVLPLQKARHVPLYIGEFNIEPYSSPGTLKEYVGAMTDAGLNWSMWTYKTLARGGPMGFWGYFCSPSPATAIDPFQDPEDDMLQKIDLMRTEFMRSPAGLPEALKQ